MHVYRQGGGASFLENDGTLPLLQSAISDCCRRLSSPTVVELARMLAVAFKRGVFGRMRPRASRWSYVGAGPASPGWQ
jgi:hypothetical protein